MRIVWLVALRCSALVISGVVLPGCSGGAKYPEGSQSIYCTDLIDDCGQQAAEQCPGGYQVLHTAQSISHLAAQSRAGTRAPAVHHRSIRIMCDPVAEATDGGR